jgi:hypothetical protein
MPTGPKNGALFAKILSLRRGQNPQMNNQKEVFHKKKMQNGGNH